MFGITLEERDIESCRNGSSTTPNGLEYTVQCYVNYPDGDLLDQPPNTDSLESCMDACSTENPLCRGVSWNPTDLKCYMKDGTTLNSHNETASNVTYSAIANTTQLSTYNVTCPYTNGQLVSVSSDLDFTIYCNKEFEQHDFLPEGWIYRRHADSLMECMEFCTEAHPLCSAVVWNPDMIHGYANCWTKNSSDTSYVIASTNHSSHVAIASFTYPVTTCADDSVYTDGDVSFQMHCQEDVAESSINSTHADSIYTCMGLCAEYLNTTSSCSGVNFDSTMTNGYDNCYIKNSSSFSITPDTTTNYTFAKISNGGTKSQHKSDAGVIAGAIVGSVVGVALLAALAWFWFRKRSSKRPLQRVETVTVPEPVEESYTDTEEAQGEFGPDKPTLHELSSTRPTYELHGSDEPTCESRPVGYRDVGGGVYHELMTWNGNGHEAKNLK